MPAKGGPDDESLKRLGGGRWQTRDERFTIEPESGTWVVVDAEQTDELGLPLVRGPFPSLTAAKAAIAAARTSEPAASPLAGRLAAKADRRKEPEQNPAETRHGDEPGDTSEPEPHRTAAPAKEAKAETRPVRSRQTAESPAEPDWIADLAATERGRARRLIAALSAAGIADAEGIVRRDLAGDVAAIAAVAVERRLAALGDDADPRAVAAEVAEGRDDELGVRWRLVDGDGRPIQLDTRDRKRPG